MSIKNRRPDHSSVNGFPDAAIDRTEIKSCRVTRNAGHSCYATATERSNQTPLEAAQKLWRNGLSDCSNGKQQREKCRQTAAGARSDFQQVTSPLFHFPDGSDIMPESVLP